MNDAYLFLGTGVFGAGMILAVWLACFVEDLK
jgi:hypothetical protein